MCSSDLDAQCQLPVAVSIQRGRSITIRDLSSIIFYGRGNYVSPQIVVSPEENMGMAGRIFFDGQRIVA